MGEELSVLRNGIARQMIGVGTYKASVECSMKSVIHMALNLGYRGIDTAEHYGNEVQVGEAIGTSGVERNEIFLTTKIWNEDHGYDKTMKAFEKSQKCLGTYIDLLLIHWPCPMNGLYEETWKALQDLYKDGKVRGIGVSNFKTGHLEKLRRMGGELPMVNQIEMHPFFIDWDMLAYCKEYGICVEAWSPLLRGKKLFEHPMIGEIASHHYKTPAQVTLRYLTQLGSRVLVKASDPEHARQNMEIFDFRLSEEEMTRMKTLNTGKRYYQDPDEYFL